MQWGRKTFGLLMCGPALLLVGCQSSSSSRFSWPSVFNSTSSTEIRQVGYDENEEASKSTGPMLTAESLFREEKFEKAEDMFSSIADDTKQRPEIAEKARFYHAESLRRQGYYPKAVDAYHRLLQDFPSGVYRGQATSQMYMIANEWLQPVREEIEDAAKPENERRKKAWVDSIVLVNFDRKLPTMDTENRALQTLEKVYFNDPTGQLADRTMFMIGRVHYHRGNYRDAARWFQQLVDTADKSPLRDEALEMAIISKNNSTGGPNYDGRDTAEAMRLINMAKSTSPKLVQERGKLLDDQALAVRYQQAEKDYETAEFYRRTGHPASAHFYYELVIRRYPGIGKFAEMAKERQAEISRDRQELADPSSGTSTRWFWKKYVLGHEVPAPAKAAEAPEQIKEIPDERPQPVKQSGRAEVPQDIRPR